MYLPHSRRNQLYFKFPISIPLVHSCKIPCMVSNQLQRFVQNAIGM
ncbi:hypothetical protein PHET_01890 [Paragonimus heterotremus]|uniref:Uncharacterized protein n=1 Tax=Paragonimus heterotremus TaxID=100268 RepID=A0A8J4TDL8_9TREM|nr:hypothetical protein PHET_01890 [Paragonimus heterotremus]